MRGITSTPPICSCLLFLVHFRAVSDRAVAQTRRDAGIVCMGHQYSWFDVWDSRPSAINQTGCYEATWPSNSEGAAGFSRIRPQLRAWWPERRRAPSDFIGGHFSLCSVKRSCFQVWDKKKNRKTKKKKHQSMATWSGKRRTETNQWDTTTKKRTYFLFSCHFRSSCFNTVE